MLGIPDHAVHDRAHAALAVLAPRQARGLDAEHRLEIGDYILGQQPGVAERIRTRTYLQGDDGARAWAQALADELSEMANGALPEIPPPAAAQAQGEEQAGAHAQTSSEERLRAAAESVVTEEATGGRPGLPSSRAGGALLLVAILVIVAIVVAVLDSGGSTHKAAGIATHSASTASTTTKSTTGPKETARIAMRSPNAASRSIGVVQIIAEGEKRAFYAVAEHISPNHGFFYALWLYNSPKDSLPLGKAPTVGSNERLEGGGPLPNDAASFKEVLLTRETSTHATRPGKVVLSGSFTLSG